jgi:2-methylcitrate dehydratase PrpD
MTQKRTNPVGARMAAFIADSPGRHYDPAVVDMAKRCLVDWMGVAIGAHREPVSIIVNQTALAWRARGRARILFGDETAPALAALVNATMGHALDFDDTRGHAPSHLSSPTWSAALAVASDKQLDGAAALGAFIVGYEVSAVLGDQGFGVRMQRVGFHPTAVFGRLAAAAATAALLGLDRQQAAHALGLAGTSGGGLTASFGTMAKPYHSGKAAMDGVQAAELAARGFEAAVGLFDGEGAFADSFVQDSATRFDDLKFTAGQSLFDNSFKPYACGKLIHAHIDAARALRAAVAGRDIKKIRCSVAPHVKHLVGRPAPTTPLEGKFSIAFCVALALCGHRVLSQDFSARRLADPKIGDLIRKIELQVVEDIKRYGAMMDIVLEDGETLNAVVAVSRGNPENPLSWDDLKDKFNGLVGPVIGARAPHLYDALRMIEEPGSLIRIFEMLQRVR